MNEQNPETTQRCPECGAARKDDSTCQDDFYQMLFWENEYPINGEVHHLLVLSYQLQHPSRYSQKGLEWGIGLLRQFVEGDLTPGEARRRMQVRVDSTNRKWKISGSQASRGAYPNPVEWDMTIADVVRRGEEAYRQSVRKWAESILNNLETSGNL